MIFDEVITSLVVVVLKETKKKKKNFGRSLDAEGGKKSLISSSM
jgi:hypothetical protein